MSFDANLNLIIPYDTALAAHQIYNNNHIYIQIGDNLEKIFQQVNFSYFDPSSHLNPAFDFRLALTCCFQFAESLPDSSVTLATMKRIDWKYALFLSKSHPGISIESLCNYRQSLCSSSKAIQEFGDLLIALGDFGLFEHSSSSWRDPRATLSIICQTNRISKVLEGMKSALGLVVSVAPEWVKGKISPHWYERYKTSPLSSPNFSQISDFQKYANQVGFDISKLLSALKKPDAPELESKREILFLTNLFQEDYLQNGDLIQWRNPGCANCLCHQQLIEGGHI